MTIVGEWLITGEVPGASASTAEELRQLRYDLLDALFDVLAGLKQWLDELERTEA